MGDTDGWDDLVGQCLDAKTSNYHCYYKTPYQHCLVSYMIKEITDTGIKINFLPAREAGYVVMELMKGGKHCNWVVVHPWVEKFCACNVDICGTDCKYFDLRYVEGALDRARGTCHKTISTKQDPDKRYSSIKVPDKKQSVSAQLHMSRKKHTVSSRM